MCVCVCVCVCVGGGLEWGWNFQKLSHLGGSKFFARKGNRRKKGGRGES